MLKKAAILLFFIAIGQNLFAYRDVPVLTHLGKAEQKDTFGFNLVEAIPQLVYNLIRENKVTLWDSPKKTIKIGFDALTSIEKNSKSSFAQTGDLFINEVWSSNRKRTTFNIIGFSFINKSGRSDRVSFGYVDFEDIFQILSDSIIATNANGTYNTSYVEALYSRHYHYNVVQFGNDNFKDNLLKAIQIKEKAFGGKKKIVNKVYLPLLKNIEYEVVKTNRGQQLYAGVEDFFNTYPEFFFNHGGYKIFNHLQSSFRFSISKIDVVELWEKKDGLTLHKPLNLIIYFGDVAMPPISVEDFNKYGLKVDFTDLGSMLKNKGFDYQITKINNQAIPPAQSGKYIRALENYFWTQITDYVKYD